jgi:hypothetical protein
MAMNEAIIIYFGQTAKVVCDRKCEKAWGRSARPKVHLSDDEDDYAYLSDGELGTAPARPRSFEGNDSKPLSPDEFPNKWCVRECERCEISNPGEWDAPLEPISFEQRVYNIPRDVAPKSEARVARTGHD